MKCRLLFNLFILFNIFINSSVVALIREFNECHDDFTLHPSDGLVPPLTFPWLGFIQFVHVITGIASMSKVPRAVVIHKQFALASCKDVNKLPKNYVLGNLVLDDYEREESDCGMDAEQIKRGDRCVRAVIDMPIAYVICHPEHIRFNVKNSLALVKLKVPIKSPYVVPICLPSYEERKRKEANKTVFIVDYHSSVPIDFDIERKAKKTLRLLTQEECQKNTRRQKLTGIVFHSLCTSGCGMRSGSPIVTQTPEGAFEVVGISVGGRLCENKNMRRRVLLEPPVYIDVYPFRRWIINVVTANVMPQVIPATAGSYRGGRRQSLTTGFFRTTDQKQGWKGKWFAVGDTCFRKYREQKKETNFFYMEEFEVLSHADARVRFNMELSAGFGLTILCAKMKMPNRKAHPKIEGLGTYKVNVSFETTWFPSKFYFVMGLFGANSTEQNFKKWRLENTVKFWADKYTNRNY